MGMPEQVRRQVELANELHNQAYGDGEVPAGETTPAVTPSEEPQVEQPAVEPQVTEQPAAVAQPAAPEPAPAVDPWEHKYKTLQGMYSAEAGRWNTEKRAFEERIHALEQAQAATPATVQASPESLGAVTDKDVETYGPELLDVIARRADAIVAKRLAELKPELDKTREQVTSVATRVYQSDEERFFGELAKEVSDWQQVNADTRWLAWLNEVDPLSGVRRQVYLNNAKANHDHVRAAALFDAFKESAGLNKPAAPVIPTKPELSPSPRTVGNATAPTHREQDNSVSRSQIAAHYRRGSTDPSYRGGPEHKAMEQRIAQAMADNQIIEG